MEIYEPDLEMETLCKDLCGTDYQYVDRFIGIAPREEGFYIQLYTGFLRVRSVPAYHTAWFAFVPPAVREDIKTHIKGVLFIRESNRINKDKVYAQWVSYMRKHYPVSRKNIFQKIW